MKPRLSALLCALVCLPAFAAPQEKTVSSECHTVMRQSAFIFCPQEVSAAAGGMGKLADIYKQLDAPVRACEQKYGRLSEQNDIVHSIPGLTDLLDTVKMADMKAPSPALKKKAAAYCAAQNEEIVRVIGRRK